ncbi:hypothetical protein SAMN05421761_11571 [Belliella pelovolcani]|uniref:Uncharacterized protein n=1 Tax=Belliella pelovolcani TaxID=529505 RepID=A0A1N7PD22_9BACT|nr:hypothetical protein SAMN05421761_11571 [Belliella pelovolcani]
MFGIIYPNFHLNTYYILFKKRENNFHIIN